MRALGSVLAILLVVLTLFVPAEAVETGRFGFGINYGTLNNFRVWNSASTESGGVLIVSYVYDFNDFYTTALELGFFADNNVLKDDTFAGTGSYLNIDHIFHTRKIGQFSPYVKFGTGIYSSDLWRKQNGSFGFNASSVIADLSAGVGADFELWKALVNVDLFFPALFRLAIFGQKLPYVLSLGSKYYF